MQFHEAANLFPMEEATLPELAADLKKNGQRVPIELFEGKILDGRRRFRACGLAQVEPKFIEVSPTDPVSYVLSLNLHRRHLTPSQLALVGARAREIYDRQAKERMAQGGGDKKSGVENLPHPIQDVGKARDAAGKAVGVSGKLIDAATKVLEKGVPELVEAVDQGRMAVTTAAIVAHEREEEQRERVKSQQKRNYADLQKNKQKETPKATRHAVVNGVVYDAPRYADMAIEQLKRIKEEDPNRDSALARVEEWVKRARKVTQPPQGV